MFKKDVTMRIELEGGRRVFSAGDTLRGTLHVEATEEVTCKALTLEIGWNTHGRGNTHEVTIYEVEVLSGTLPAGHSEHPFECRLPNGPFTYHGHYLNIDWWVYARADIAWAIDPKVELEIALEPAAGAAGSHAPLAYELSERGLTEIAAGEVSGKEILFLLIGLAMIVGGMIGVVLEENLWFLALPFFGLFFVYEPLRRMLAELKLGTVHAEISPRELRQGERLRCQVRCKPGSNTELAAAELTLVGKEVVISGSGTNRTTHTHTFWEVPLEGVQLPERIVGGEPLKLEGVAELLPDQALSFHAPDNSVVWAVVVHLDITGWPDWVREIDLHVLPGAEVAPRRGEEEEVEEPEMAGVAW